MVGCFYSIVYVPAGLPSRGGDVTAYVYYVNQPTGGDVTAYVYDVNQPTGGDVTAYVYDVNQPTGGGTQGVDESISVP